VSLKARLLFVSWIKVDGKLVYKAEPKPTDADRDERDTDVPRLPPSRKPPRPSLPGPPPKLPMKPLPMLPHWKLPSRSDPQGPVPGALSSSTRVRIRPSP
jgi:hypothetical protein